MSDSTVMGKNSVPSIYGMRAFVENGKPNKEEFTKSRNFMNQKEFAASWNSTNNGYANSYWNSRRIVTVIAGSSFEPTEESSEL
jgi:hypothetical protein